MRFGPSIFEVSPAPPDTGRLRVNVFEITAARPAPSARIRVTEPGQAGHTVAELLADGAGQTAVLELETPPAAYPPESGRPRLCGIYDLHVEMDGCQPVVVEGVRIFPNCTAVQEVYWHPPRPDEQSPEVIVAGEPAL